MPDNFNVVKEVIDQLDCIVELLEDDGRFESEALQIVDLMNSLADRIAQLEEAN
jgi:hypothetical protein